MNKEKFFRKLDDATDALEESVRKPWIEDALDCVSEALRNIREAMEYLKEERSK